MDGSSVRLIVAAGLRNGARSGRTSVSQCHLPPQTRLGTGDHSCRDPRVTLHALRHSHASALIAAGQDVLTISRRLGHGSPNVTLAVQDGGALVRTADILAGVDVDVLDGQDRRSGDGCRGGANLVERHCSQQANRARTRMDLGAKSR